MNRLGTLLLVALLPACSGLTTPEEDGGWLRVVGLVDHPVSSLPLLMAMQPVRAGTPVEVTVTTYGSSSCTRPGGTDVSVSGLVTDVTPYDSVPPAGTPCTRDMRGFPHTVELLFPDPGEATIRVHGRTSEGSTTIFPIAITVEG